MSKYETMSNGQLACAVIDKFYEGGPDTRVSGCESYCIIRSTVDVWDGIHRQVDEDYGTFNILDWGYVGPLILALSNKGYEITF